MPIILILAFPIGSDNSSRISSLFKNTVLSLLSIESLLNSYLPSDLVCFQCFLMHSIMLNSFGFLFLFLNNFSLLDKLLFLVSNFIPEFFELPDFSCSLLNFYLTAILNSLSVRFQYSLSLSLIAGELLLSL